MWTAQNMGLNRIFRVLRALEPRMLTLLKGWPSTGWWRSLFFPPEPSEMLAAPWSAGSTIWGKQVAKYSNRGCMQYLGHRVKHYLVFIWNSCWTRHPLFLFAKSVSTVGRISPFSYLCHLTISLYGCSYDSTLEERSNWALVRAPDKQDCLQKLFAWLLAAACLWGGIRQRRSGRHLQIGFHEPI